MQNVPLTSLSLIFKNLWNHIQTTADIKAPRQPNYNFTSPDFHWLIAQQQPIQPGAEEDWIDEFMRNRYGSAHSLQ